MNITPTSSFRRKQAFTLIELLTVIAIIGILAAIIIPVSTKVRESAKRSQCLSNVRQIGMAMSMYANDNKNRLPVMQDANSKTWDRFLLEGNYLTKSTVFSCPSDVNNHPSFNYRDLPGAIPRSYAYNKYITDAPVGSQLSKITKPLSQVILAADGGFSLAALGRVEGCEASGNNQCQQPHRAGDPVGSAANYRGANYVFLDMHAAWMVNSGDSTGDTTSQELHNRHWRADLP